MHEILDQRLSVYDLYDLYDFGALNTFQLHFNKLGQSSIFSRVAYVDSGEDGCFDWHEKVLDVRDSIGKQGNAMPCHAIRRHALRIEMILG